MPSGLPGAYQDLWSWRALSARSVARPPAFQRGYGGRLDWHRLHHLFGPTSDSATVAGKLELTGTTTADAFPACVCSASAPGSGVPDGCTEERLAGCPAQLGELLGGAGVVQPAHLGPGSFAGHPVLCSHGPSAGASEPLRSPRLCRLGRVPCHHGSKWGFRRPASVAPGADTPACLRPVHGRRAASRGAFPDPLLPVVASSAGTHRFVGQSFIAAVGFECAPCSLRAYLLKPDAFNDLHYPLDGVAARGSRHPQTRR